MELFDALGYPWWLQGQVVFLSARGRPVPEIERRELRLLFSDNWIRHAADPTDRAGFSAVMCPGVDGDLISIFSATDAFQQQLLEALEDAATRAGFAWMSLTEEAFGDCLTGKRVG